MDLDSILYIVLVVGWLGLTVFKNLKKEDVDPAKKRNSRPVVEENPNRADTTSSKRRARPTVEPSRGNDEYFSYETMSERDFAQEFGHVSDESVATSSSKDRQSQNIPHLTFEEEEVFKGIVWSEILKRKY